MYWLGISGLIPSPCLLAQNPVVRFLPDNLADTVWALVDVGLVVILTYMMLVVIGERRTLWMVRGFIILMLAAAISTRLELRLLSFVLGNLVVGSAVAMAFILQSEFRRFLEQLGRGQILQLIQPYQRSPYKATSTVDEIVDAVKELSQNRTGALMIIETASPIDERDFSVPGVKLNAEVSKELLQTIFQTSTLLHDGAVLIRDTRIVAAGVILPLSERTASRQLGTRHRAAMGITERVENCICVVVSEETGSISLAERGTLNRPLTSSKLKELLEARLSQLVDRETGAPDLRSFSRRVVSKTWAFFKQLITRRKLKG
ncbi:MAG: TIGR00159 family protein [Oscillatoriales cyanobacterium C42_A2020_001]|nr:TIGR00159 family protein [Leptolyngbyaceae cyanobacterium C42_A2020_001]